MFDMLVQYVARNIHFVDSLVNFPDIIGKRLFEAFLAKFILQPSEETSENFLQLSVNGLDKFLDAYGRMVISQLNVCGKCKLVRKHQALVVPLLHHLSALDISNCLLGDADDMLQRLGELESLTTLLMCNNYLSDNGVQRLTCRSRVRRRGLFMSLNVLSLSENPQITKRSLKYLLCCQNLQVLNVTNTSITQKCLEEIDLIGFTVDSTYKLPTVETEGWAAPLISTWLQHFECPSAIATQCESKAASFYGRVKLSDAKMKSMPCRRVPDSGKLVLVRECTSKEQTSVARLRNMQTFPHKRPLLDAASVANHVLVKRRRIAPDVARKRNEIYPELHQV